jgi:hypothetical protein
MVLEQLPAVLVRKRFAVLILSRMGVVVHLSELSYPDYSGLVIAVGLFIGKRILLLY